MDTLPLGRSKTLAGGGYGVGENWEIVKEKIVLFSQKARRKPEDIKVVAVTKGVEISKIEDAISLGLVSLGENRVQEALKKMPLLPEEVEWHFVGRLQRNKAKKVVKFFQCLHSLDSIDKGEELEKRARDLNKKFPVLIQVNLTGRETQGGVREEELLSLVYHVAQLSHLELRGLMTIGPVGGEEQEVREIFSRLRELKEEVNREMPRITSFQELSMGMSDDFPWAILEGATILRLGRAIFGERSE
ncbi:MAG TPA: YggS family pyridoxal phosphate-dependent enzyme [Candidatus Atribacteria bacterium]|nr:YggS family pyridoxal phosphate-dependent enzyme [Candidatus Atribacteria bacterium]